MPSLSFPLVSSALPVNDLAMKSSRRHTQDLLKGRLSIPGARYFITVCATRPCDSLTTFPAVKDLADRISTVFAPPDASLLCATLMPDHIHLLLTLGPRLSIERLIAKFKTKSRQNLPSDIAWQRNFFEHRLRPDESAGTYARYIFLNPYRKGLLQPNDRWPLWILGSGVDFDFLQQLDDGGCPPPAWLEESDAPHPTSPPNLGSSKLDPYKMNSHPPSPRGLRGNYSFKYWNIRMFIS